MSYPVERPILYFKQKFSFQLKRSIISSGTARPLTEYHPKIPGPENIFYDQPENAQTFLNQYISVMPIQISPTEVDPTRLALARDLDGKQAYSGHQERCLYD